MNRNNAINLGVWIGLLLVIGICGVLINFRLFMLATHYDTAKGVVSEKLPNEHLSIKVAYVVDGRKYDCIGSDAEIKQGFDAIHYGDIITVFYDKQSPDNSSLEAPSSLFIQGIIGRIFAIALILSVIGMCILHRYQRLPYCSIFEKCRRVG